VPRALIAALCLAALGCNEIRYQAGRLRAAAPPLEVPKAAELPDRRLSYECKDGEPFSVYFPPGGAGAVLSLGGDEYALRDVPAAAGKRYGDEHYELYLKDGVASVSLDDKRIRGGCRATP
jgi:membrane-bound inhibitor of C-type lysozyme